jgi:hypothetical protein
MGHVEKPANATVSQRVRTSFALLICVSWLAGCQSMSREEKTWQVLHAMDVAQTLNAASDPCYREKAWLTKRLIGEQPSDGQVIAWGVGTAVMHAWVSNGLEERGAPRWVQKLWELGTLGHTSYAIGSNHEAGVRPFGSNRDVENCYVR